MQKDKHHCQKLLIEKIKYRVTIKKSSKGYLNFKQTNIQPKPQNHKSKANPQNTATHTLKERKTTNAQKVYSNQQFNQTQFRKKKP